MLRAILFLIVLTFVPALELRASIPVGIFSMQEDLGWPAVVAICAVANILLGWLVFALLNPAFGIVRRWNWFEKHIWPRLEKTQHRLHPYVEKYGELGVALFIGVPLPGSGVYSGALGSYLLGLDRRKFAIANVLGVVIAATAVTALCLLVLHGVVGEDSWMVRLFLKMRSA